MLTNRQFGILIGRCTVTLLLQIWFGWMDGSTGNSWENWRHMYRF